MEDQIWLFLILQKKLLMVKKLSYIIIAEEKNAWAINTEGVGWTLLPKGGWVESGKAVYGTRASAGRKN